MIIGFGKTEEEQRKITRDWIFDTIKEIYNKHKGEYIHFFTDEMIDEFKKRFKEYQYEIKKEYEKADKSKPRPERYYHIDFGVAIANDITTLFVKIDFWHINSRHAFSPDGMALMQYPKTFTITTEEL